VFPNKEDPERWRIDEMDYDGRTLFVGQDAERRAQEYAEWLESRAVPIGSAHPPA
jgi:hypothetical protein